MDILKKIHDLPTNDRNKIKTIISLILSYKFSKKDIANLILIIGKDSYEEISHNYITPENEKMLTSIELNKLRTKVNEIGHVFKLISDILNEDLQSIIKEYLIFRLKKSIKEENVSSEVDEKEKNVASAKDQYLLYLGKLIRKNDTINDLQKPVKKDDQQNAQGQNAQNDMSMPSAPSF